MARTANPHSAASQFFINLNDNASLNHSNKTLSGWGYCVFGRVAQGMDVVDAIAALDLEDEWPVQDVFIERVTLLSPDAEQP
jgi:cyclophilin family peptidyl-prolyl cis-trans isomerase